MRWFNRLFAGYSVPMDGKRQVCKDAEVLPVLVGLLRDKDVEVQANAAGVIMNTVIITTGTNAHRLPQPSTQKLQTLNQDQFK